MTTYKRKDWGARPPKSLYVSLPSPSAAVIHHSAGPIPKSVEHAKTMIRSYQWQHMFTRQLGPNGAIDIGYHVLFDGEGNAYEGRPFGTLGAHARGGNELTGICLLGNYDEIEPARAVIIAVHGYCRENGIREVAPHSAVTPTRCPGDRGRIAVAMLNAHLDREWTPLYGPEWPPPHGRTLRLDWISRSGARGRAAGWSEANNRLVSIARYPEGWRPRSAAIAWRGNIWRGRTDVINVAKHLVHKFGLEYR